MVALLHKLQNALRTRYLDLPLLVGLAIAVRIPAYFLEREPYLFCDESIYTGEAVRMLTENTWITSEFRAGGLNTYLILISLILAREMGLYPYHMDVFDVARAVETVALGSATSIFIYFAAIKLYEKRAAGIISGLVFVLAPGSLAYSRFAYPDHYIYFFSSAVLFYLISFLKDSSKSRYLVGVGAFAGLAISVKYTAMFLIIPILVALFTNTISNSILNARVFVKRFSIVFLSLMFTLLSFNFSAVLKPQKFLDGVFFNVDNYSSSSGTYVSGITYYVVVAFIIFFGAATLPLWLVGMWRIFKDKQIYFGILISFPVALIAYLGSLGLVLNRNMSILIPFVIIPISGGVLYIFGRGFMGKSKIDKFLQLAVLCAIFLGAAQAIYGVHRDTRPDSRVVAHDWIKQNLESVEAVGTNEFCSGHSPALGVVPQIISDPMMEMNLPIYVFNSYWSGPFAPYYTETRPFWQEPEQKMIHFYHFQSRELFKGSAQSRNFNDYVPSDYVVLKRVAESGPEIIILIRSDLVD